MSSICSDPKGLSSGKRFYMQLWYGTFYMQQSKQSSMQKSVLDTITVLYRTIP
jgi:hypothetical protein